jgi:pilus assembly protein Flp/PilA
MARVLGDLIMVKTFVARLSALKADTRGVTAMEYGLIAAFIAVAIIGGLTLLGGNLDAMLNGIAAKFVAPT